MRITYGTIASKVLSIPYTPFYTRYVRANLLKMLGHRIVNPYHTGYNIFPWQKMDNVLIDIFKQISQPLKFNNVIDHGCGNGHYYPLLKKYSKTVYGIDVLDDGVADVYLKPDGLSILKDKSIDCVFIFSLYGLISTWQDYFKFERIEPYLSPGQFPRVLRNNGLIVVIEWESKPERKWYPITADPVIPGFKIIKQGYSVENTGPWLVMRKEV